MAWHKCPGYAKAPGKPGALSRSDSVGFSRLFWVALAFMPGRGRFAAPPYPTTTSSRAETSSSRPAPSSGPAVFTQQRSTSATLQAWATQPLGV
jgi:hypothetical protein